MTHDNHIRVIGFDPSLRHWGISAGWYDLVAKTIQIESLAVLDPTLPTGKQVRQNSEDLEAAKQLYEGAYAAAVGAQAIFVEVPHGSQSAAAMKGYGVCIGVLASLRANGIAFFELNEAEVKKCAVGRSKQVPKKEMIAWAMKAHPEVRWPSYKRNGVELISEAQAEHMADATAAIHAGISSNQFQQVLPFFTRTAVTL